MIRILYGALGLMLTFCVVMYAKAQYKTVNERHAKSELNEQIAVNCKKYRSKKRQQRCADRITKEFDDRIVASKDVHYE